MAFNEKYVSVAGSGSGNGSSPSNSWTLAQANAGAVAGDRVNILSGSYTISANATFPSGATENPIIWQGYNSTIGDLALVGRDGVTGPLISTNFPVLSGGSSYNFTAGAFNNFRNLKFITGANAAVFNTSSTSNLWRCIFENTHATGSGAKGLLVGSHYIGIIDCDCVIATNHASACSLSVGRSSVIGCRVWNSTGPYTTQVGINSADAASQQVVNNVIFNVGVAISLGSTSGSVFGNTWYNVVAGININAAFVGVIANNVGWLHSDFAIRGTTASGNPLLLNNAFGSHTSGRLETSTLGTVIEEINPVLLTSDPFLNAASGDFTLNNEIAGGLLCKKASMLWGKVADLGAVQSYLKRSNGYVY